MSALEATGVLPERDLMWGRVPLQLHASPSTWQPTLGLPNASGLPTGVRGALGVPAANIPGAARNHASVPTVADIESAADACMGDMHAFAKVSWSATHAAAVARGDNFYEDPETKLMVMTELVHRSRGSCCGKACRHCPFMHERVVLRSRPNDIARPAWLVPPQHLNTPHKGKRQATLNSAADTAAGAVEREVVTTPSAATAPSGSSSSSSDSDLTSAVAATTETATAAADSASAEAQNGVSTTEISVLISGCSDRDLQVAVERQKQGETVVLVAPLSAESRMLDGTDMHAKEASQAATDTGVLLVGLPVHASGPTHSELLRDALQVAVTAVTVKGVQCVAEVQESLGEAAEQWRIAVDTLELE